MARKQTSPPRGRPGTPPPPPDTGGDATRLPGWLIAGAAALATVVALAAFLATREPAGPAPAATRSHTAAAPPEFVGSEACASCHAAEHERWRGSQHARAMQHATAGTVLGDFSGTTFRHAGVESTFARRDGRFYVTTDGPDGRLAGFEVKYTFGVEPLQQYLVELPGGRLQALSIAWDTRPAADGGQRWVHLYPGERIDYRDELHWTRPAQNWNFMCADCHSTDLRKGYAADGNRYATRYAAINVGCEACHGPASAHVEWARNPREGTPAKGLTIALDERRGVTWAMEAATGNARRSSWRESEREIEVCAQCHARRAQVAEGYRAGAPFLDHYVPALITPGLYHPDGQQRDEVYVWGSFLQSRMHAAGVTCSDCHEPHGQQLRVPGNGTCAQCHDAGKYATAEHHHHAPDSAAGACVACHMPATTYMVVDPRRDHSLRIPRPDRSVTLGTPNACNGCHRDRDAAWAAAAARRWYGEPPPGFQDFAEAFHAADSGAPGAGASLQDIAADVSRPAIVRASALARLSSTPGPDPATAARTGATDPSPLVRLAAARLAETLPPPERLAVATPLLADPVRTVRTESARVLPAVPAGALTAERAGAWNRATGEYVTTLEYTADRAESRVALGTLRASQGRYAEAQTAFAGALELDDRFVPAYLNAADAHRAAGDDDSARRLLEAGLARIPDDAALHHSLGLALARQQQPAAALEALGRAAALDPGDERYAYVHGVALNSYGRRAEALQVLQRAAARWPANRDIGIAVVTIRRDAGDLAGARRAARALATAHPDDLEVRALLDETG